MVLPSVEHHVVEMRKSHRRQWQPKRDRFTLGIAWWTKITNVLKSINYEIEGRIRVRVSYLREDQDAATTLVGTLTIDTKVL